jgi:dienelactone hydrolase
MSFWAEFRRRKVFQVGAAYAVVGWVLIQVAIAVFPKLQLPEWTQTFVTILVIFCFPIALFLAWAYELTPSGIQRTAPAPDNQAGKSSPRVFGYATIAVVAATLGAAGYWIFESDRDSAWLPSALTRIERYLDNTDWEAAYALVREVQERFPESTELEGLWTRVSWTTTIPSDPPGARVYRRKYGTDNDWELLGTTPLENIRIPLGLSEIRLELDGYRTIYRTLGGGHLNWDTLGAADATLDMLLVGPEVYRMDPEDSIPADKVRVRGWTFPRPGRDLELKDYLLGRYEVTNKEFKAFVDDGGYRRANLWDPIVVDGATVPLESAAKLFIDRTGRPGPSTWSAGDYPDGEDDMPVSGVSWYEASAYARWANQELPSAPHWQQAIAFATFPWLLELSNFSGQGPRRVTESRAMSYSGAFDMAGNVREWAANSIGDEKIILGGSYNDAYYIAGTRDASAPAIDRSPGNGFRLAITEDPPEVRRAMRFTFPPRFASAPGAEREQVDDATYAAYSLAFDYDEDRPLAAHIEERVETRVWVREKVTFDAAYGNERAVLYLYLPTNGTEPFQTVVYWCGWDTFRLNDVDHYFARQIDFLVKSGRAVAFPVFPGTFERQSELPGGMPPFNTQAWRDNAVDSVKDVRRTIDYLQTRREIDSSSLAYFGYSWGGVNGPVALAQEDRLKVAVIEIGLMPPMPSNPQVDPYYSLPRIHVPTLMFSGEFDPMVSRDNAQKYFDLIGAPDDQKVHQWAKGGHFIPRDLLIEKSLDWLDRYLGRPP